MSYDLGIIYKFIYDDNFWIIVVFGTLLVNLLARGVLRRLKVGLEKRSITTWPKFFSDSAPRPLSSLIWVLGIAYAAKFAPESTESIIIEYIYEARTLGIVAAFTWFLILLVRNAKRSYLISPRPSPRFDRPTLDTIERLLRVSIIISASLVALDTLGFGISGVLAFGGIGAIAVGFAAKDLLANVFSGLMISLDQPFAINDLIYSPDKDIEGFVEDISWRLTKIRAFDTSLIYIPNSLFSTMVLRNPSRRTHRLIWETIGIRHEDAPKIAGIVRDVKQMLVDHPDIDTTQFLAVNFSEFGAISLDFFIYTLTKTTKWGPFYEIKEDVLLKVLDIITLHGAKLARLTSTLQLLEGANIPEGDIDYLQLGKRASKK